MESEASSRPDVGQIRLPTVVDSVPLFQRQVSSNSSGTSGTEKKHSRSQSWFQKIELEQMLDPERFLRRAQTPPLSPVGGVDATAGRGFHKRMGSTSSHAPINISVSGGEERGSDDLSKTTGGHNNKAVNGTSPNKKDEWCGLNLSLNTQSDNTVTSLRMLSTMSAFPELPRLYLPSATSKRTEQRLGLSPRGDRHTRTEMAASPSSRSGRKGGFGGGSKTARRHHSPLGMNLGRRMKSGAGVSYKTSLMRSGVSSSSSPSSPSNKSSSSSRRRSGNRRTQSPDSDTMNPNGFSLFERQLDLLHTTCSSLYRLRCKINETPISRDAEDKFIYQLQANWKKQNMSFRGCTLPSSALPVILTFLDEAERLSRSVAIKSLDLSENGFDDEALVLLGKYLETHHTITNITYCSNHTTSTGFVSFFQSLARNKSVETLNFSCNAATSMLIGDTGLKQLAQTLLCGVNLRKLRMRNVGLQLVHTRVLRLFGRAISGSAGMRTLDLCRSRFSPMQINALFSGLNEHANECILETIVLRDSTIGDLGAVGISEFIRAAPVLENVDVSNGGISLIGFVMLSDGVGANLSMRRLLMDGNDLSGAPLSKRYLKPTDDPEYDKIEQLIATRKLRDVCVALSFCCGSLEKLSMKQCRLSTRLLRDLSAVLKQSTTIQHLNFAYNNIDDTAAEYIAQMISEVRTLRYLDLSMNRIGDEGGSLIAHALYRNKRVSEVFLSSNEMRGKAARVLVNTLSSCHDIHTCTTDGNHIEFEDQLSLNEVSAANRRRHQRNTEALRNNTLLKLRDEELALINTTALLQQSASTHSDVTDKFSDVSTYVSNKKKRETAQTGMFDKALQDLVMRRRVVAKLTTQFETMAQTRKKALSQQLKDTEKKLDQEVQNRRHAARDFEKFRANALIGMDDIGRMQAVLHHKERKVTTIKEEIGEELNNAQEFLDLLLLSLEKQTAASS